MKTELNRIKKILNEDPPVKSVKHTTAGADRFSYIPISWYEATLDRIFEPWGWSYYNATYEVISNEITCRLELEVEFPNGRKKRTIGFAAVPIQFDSGANITQWEKKKAKALVKNLPSVKSVALKNACKPLGKIFGRDISRKEDDIELFTAHEEHDAFEAYRTKLLKAESVMELNEAYSETHPQLLINPEATKLYYSRMDQITNLQLGGVAETLALDE